MEPDAGKLRAILAYLGSEAEESEVYAPTVSQTELEENLGVRTSSALIYLRERDVLDTASTERDVYISLENNRDRAVEYAQEVQNDFDGSYREYALESSSLEFIDYPSGFETGDPESVGTHIPREIVEEFSEAFSDD